MHLVQSIRMLVKRPAFSLVVITTLAIGIGATTGMYSIYRTVLIDPLPVFEPERLVNFDSPGPKFGFTSSNNAGRNDSVFSYPMFRDLESQQQSFSGIAGHRSFDANIGIGGRTSAGNGMLVSGQYFQVLGLQPAVGRLIQPEDEPRVDESSVAVLSHEYWQDYFDSDPDAIGQPIVVNGQNLTIIGVAPEGFSGTTLTVTAHVFVPLTMRWSMMPTARRDAENRQSHWVYLFARLADGTTVSQAAATVTGLYRGILAEIEEPLIAEQSDETREAFLGRSIQLKPGARGQSNVDLYAGTPLTLLLAVSALVLVIGCVNIAGLMLTAGESRVGETAIRTSIGATRIRLIGQFLGEASLLALIGCAASIPVARLTITLFESMIPPAEAGTIHFALNGYAYLFAMIVTAGAVVLFGLFPALRASTVSPGALINAYGRKATGGRLVLRFRSLLAMAQIALSAMLLVLAGLFVQSLIQISRIDLGMEADSLVAFSVSPGRNGYSPERVRGLFDGIETELAAQSGVTSVASSGVPLLTGSNWGGSINIEGLELGPDDDRDILFNRVNPDFFATFSIPLLSGRGFAESDNLDAPPVAIVNRAFLRKFELGNDVLGTRIGWGMGGADNPPSIEIVGIVADSKYSEVKAPDPALFYLPRSQEANIDTLSYYVRSALPADSVMQSSMQIVSRIDPNLPVIGMQAFPRVVEQNIFLDRMIATLSGGLAIVAVVLAALGLYSVLAYSVARRTRELGVRLALGAAPGSLRMSVMKQVAWMAVISVPVGVALAVVIGRVAEMLLFEVVGYDPIVIGSAVLAIVVVVACAGWLPARRAARTAPMEALRYE